MKNFVFLDLPKEKKAQLMIGYSLRVTVSKRILSTIFPHPLNLFISIAQKIDIKTLISIKLKFDFYNTLYFKIFNKI
jgi:hypothetical protein